MQTENTAPDNGQQAAPAGAAAPAPATQPPAGQPQGDQQQPGAGQPAANPDNSTATPPADGAQQQNGQPAGEQPNGDQGERDESGRFQSKVQKRINELTHARHQAEREAARWRAIAEGRQAPAAPSRSDYATDEDFQSAQIEHRIETRALKVTADTAQQTADQYQQEAQRAVADAYNQRVQAAAARIPDFADVVSKANIDISPALRDALVDSEHGPDIVYQLAKNPDEAARLSGLSVRQLDREIGRMEATIGAKGSTTTPPPAPAARTTNAPPPAKPGAPAAAPANTDPSTMNQEQYEAWRRAQGAKYF